MEPTCGGLPEQRAAGRTMVPGKRDSGIHLFLLAEEGVSGAERSPGSGHIVAAMEVSGVQIQVYEGADEATLQAILQAAKSC